MIYALRKLIAFVFLGGIFWFVFQDPLEIGNPTFMNTLGVMVLVFGMFWILIPILVVQIRVRKRVRQNRDGFAKWKAEHPDGFAPTFRSKKIEFLKLEDGENVWFHEKGTVYLERGAGFDEASVPGKPGDVAFPGLGSLRRKIQRTHFYITDRRIIFLGKTIDCSIPFADVRSAAVKPGGILFAVQRESRPAKMAFTFQNPLITEAAFEAAKNGANT